MTQLTINDMQPGGLIQNGRELYQVSSVYPRRITAQLLYPVPPRTSVSTFVADAIPMLFTEPTDAIVAEMDRAYGRKGA